MALGAVAASGASAKLPEWGQCRETASGSGGKYGNANCTQQVKKVYGGYRGGYEWYPLERTQKEVEEGQQTSLKSAYAQPVTPGTFKFATGREILCNGSEEGNNRELPLDGSNVVTDAAEIRFTSCEEPVLKLENHEQYPAGNCVDSAEVGIEIGTEREFENGALSASELKEREEEEGKPPTTWGGKTVFLGDKTSPTPSVGISYQSNPELERFFPQIICENGEHGQPLSIQIGGHSRGERLVEEITPVNQMLEGGFTATLRPQAGRHALQAHINTGEWETVTIEGSTYLGGGNYIGSPERRAWEEMYGEPNFRYSNDLELKATP